MKKVIFICLLSLSVCFSKPETASAATTQDVTNVTASVINKDVTPTKLTNEHKNNTSPAASTNNNTSPPASTNTTAPPAPPVTSTATAEVHSNNTTATSTNSKANTTDPKTPNNGTNVIITTTTLKPETKNDTKLDDKKDKSTEVLQARGFDGGSFVGGIILTLGLLAIGFMGYKYYKNQTERNYHTL